MAGLLPLHSEITVTKAKKIKVFGLPEQIKKQSPALKSYTLIPTNPTLWEQQGMTEAYGFDHLYSTLDYQADFEYNKKGDYLSDEKVFKFAALKDKSITSPFFSLILTFSMHQPYDTYEEHGFHLTDKNLPEKYRNYLTSCHYTDAQIGKYLDILRERGIYDNSLIVIVSDHDARPKYIDMDGIVPPEIPLYIINGGIDKTKVWNGVCNQLDVYTTILDILGIESKWRGLGHTLLNTNYQNSVTDKIQKISSNIINSDFFGTEKQN
jgi:lipoteichoic acid synthase